MRAPISVVIPTLNAEAHLPHCLAALGEGLSAGLIRDLIISDGGSQDATLQIAQAAGATVLRGPASRGGQLRRAMAEAEGTWALVLHADTTLDPGWSDAVAASLDRPGAYHFRLAFDATGPAPALVAGWANLRSRLWQLPYGDQGLLIDRATYLASGGYADIPLMEDVALADALRGQWQALPATARTSAQAYRQHGWLRRGSDNLIRLLRYRLGTAPERLARGYSSGA